MKPRLRGAFTLWYDETKAWIFAQMFRVVRREVMETSLLAERYEIQHLLGRGGMAYVYYARDRVLGRAVAVKILREEYARDERFRACFRQEATAAARLSHPNIVTVYDFGYAEDRLFIVMEYVPGETLRQIIDARAPLPPEEALSLMVQACAGLGYVHRLGLVHCDVKPQNFLVTPDGRLKITDFGIARAWAGTQEAEQAAATVVWGSPQYFSPEQAAGKLPIPASDVYALGVVLYEMLTRRLPFLADDPQELARLHREAPPVPPSAYVPDLPPALEAVLLKVLSKEPSARYRTADQFGRVLLHLAETLPAAEETAPTVAPSVSTAAPPPAPEPPPSQNTRPRDPLVVDWLTVALALLALVAVGGLIPLWVWVYLAYHGLR